MKKREQEAALVGRAFRGKDNVIRWITHYSERRIYSMLWLNEETNVWNSGGKVRAQDWAMSPYAGDEVPAPTGSYQLAGVFGSVREIPIAEGDKDHAA